MAKVTYEVVEHNGGWAYKVGDTFSETFDSHDAAHKAAETAAAGQAQGGETHDIQYEDAKGDWHLESSSGDDRPETEVKD